MNIVTSTLLIDDSLRDLSLCSIILRQSGRYPSVCTLRTGDEVMARLTTPPRGGSAPSASTLPALVLLDINMPRMNGFELLDEVRAVVHDDLARERALPPIVMLSSAIRPADRARIETHTAIKGCLVKPLRLEDAIDLAERFGDATPS